MVYSDTDSVFVRSPTPSLEGARAFGTEIARRFTARGVTFEFQSVYEALFSHGVKKRYVGRTAWPKEELVIRGYESRRTDAFDYQVSALNEVFELVLKGASAQALARARELVMKVQDGGVPPEQLVIARSVRAEAEYRYRDPGQPAVPARVPPDAGRGVRRRARHEGRLDRHRRRPGPRRRSSRGFPAGLSPEPDYGYYAERVAQTLARVTEVYDWDATSLLRGNHQRRLGEDSSGLPEEGAAATAAPRKEAIGLDAPIAAVTELPRKKRVTRTLASFEEPPPR